MFDALSAVAVAHQQTPAGRPVELSSSLDCTRSRSHITRATWGSNRVVPSERDAPGRHRRRKQEGLTSDDRGDFVGLRPEVRASDVEIEILKRASATPSSRSAQRSGLRHHGDASVDRISPEISLSQLAQRQFEVKRGHREFRRRA